MEMKQVQEAWRILYSSLDNKGERGGQQRKRRFWG
jgi:hypothetical protein